MKLKVNDVVCFEWNGEPVTVLMIKSNWMYTGGAVFPMPFLYIKTITKIGAL